MLHVSFNLILFIFPLAIILSLKCSVDTSTKLCVSACVRMDAWVFLMFGLFPLGNTSTQRPFVLFWHGMTCSNQTDSAHMKRNQQTLRKWFCSRCFSYLFYTLEHERCVRGHWGHVHVCKVRVLVCDCMSLIMRESKVCPCHQHTLTWHWSFSPHITSAGNLPVWLYKW